MLLKILHLSGVYWACELQSILWVEDIQMAFYFIFIFYFSQPTALECFGVNMRYAVTRLQQIGLILFVYFFTVVIMSH